MQPHNPNNNWLNSKIATGAVVSGIGRIANLAVKPVRSVLDFLTELHQADPTKKD